MKRMLCLAFGASILATAALAQTAAPQSCEAQATGKKLAGAAHKSFMTKCEKDASEACTKQADGKKLAGAARNSFTGKCVTDAVGKKS
jgi:hypothetical protein